MREMELRVRPLRVGLLVSTEASPGGVLTGMRFLSRIWGGRYCPIVPIRPDGDDSLSRRWLGQLHVDVLCGVELTRKQWSDVGNAAPPARAIHALDESTPDDIFKVNQLNVITSNAPLLTVMKELKGASQSR